ncbi:hypothetical protein [Pararhizobium haloflavum]|uniref:hypothetical protein n=1 Tax=Pararhizobium haloflavum TaxID=2037914 RepID=UPI0012FFF94A|nr:hypothetical protein [Pararhizobium haloflavum]
MRARVPNMHLAIETVSHRPPRDYAEPIVLPTEAGVHLAREHASAWTRGAVILVYTIAVLALGIVGGQLLQQLVTDAHAYAAAARV